MFVYAIKKFSLILANLYLAQISYENSISIICNENRAMMSGDQR